MPLPWKKSRSGRISRFVSDLQQSPKHGGSLVVETGFPTSLIDLFVKNRDRLKKSSSKRGNNKTQTTTALTAPTHSHPTRRRVSSPPTPSPSPPPLSLQRRMSLPLKLDPASVTEDLSVSKIEDSFVAESRHDGDEDGGNHGGGGGCVLMVVVFKVFLVAVLALSTKKLAVGITLSAFTLLFLEFAVARVFTLLNLCPQAQIRLDSLIGKLIGKRRQDEEEEEEESSSSTQERRNKVTFEIIEEESKEEIRVVPQSEKSSNWEDSSTLEKEKPVVVEEKKEVQTIRDVVFKTEKSKSAKLKSKIVKKIVPKKLRSYKKKKKKMKIKEKEEEVEVVEVIGEEEEEEEEGSVTEVSSLFSEERIGSEISERDDLSSNPPLLESCEEIEEEEEGEEIGSKEDLTKAMVLIVIVLAGLLSGKVFAIGLTLSSCLILRVFCCKSQTSL